MSEGWTPEKIAGLKALQESINKAGFGPPDTAEVVIERLAVLNDRIQGYISRSGSMIPAELIQLLSDLDWFVRNEGKDTKRS